MFSVRYTAKGQTQMLDHLGRIRLNIEKGIGDMGLEVARRTSDNLVQELDAQNIRDTGALRLNVGRVYKNRSGRENVSYSIGMPWYGPVLAFMKPHWVNTFGVDRPQLAIWAKRNHVNSRAMFVRPHDFITPAMRRTRMQIQDIINKHIQSMVR